MVEVQLLCRQ